MNGVQANYVQMPSQPPVDQGNDFFSQLLGTGLGLAGMFTGNPWLMTAASFMPQDPFLQQLMKIWQPGQAGGEKNSPALAPPLGNLQAQNAPIGNPDLTKNGPVNQAAANPWRANTRKM